MSRVRMCSRGMRSRPSIQLPILVCHLSRRVAGGAITLSASVTISSRVRFGVCISAPEGRTDDLGALVASHDALDLGGELVEGLGHLADVGVSVVGLPDKATGQDVPKA